MMISKIRPLPSVNSKLGKIRKKGKLQKQRGWHQPQVLLLRTFHCLFLTELSEVFSFILKALHKTVTTYLSAVTST
jgi:hypothetical protein